MTITDGWNYRDYTSNGTTVRIYDNNVVRIITVNSTGPMLRTPRSVGRTHRTDLAVLRQRSAQR